MNTYRIVTLNELNHHGVKGMKWGVRKDPQRLAQKQRMKAAKAEYRQSKKAYDKAFNKYYWKNTRIHFTDKGRRNNEHRFQKAIIASAKMNIAKGKYMQEKAKLKGNDKKIEKGKLIVKNASVNANYQSKVLKTMESGYTLREAYERHNKDHQKAVTQQQDAIAEYRKKIR